MIHYLGPQFGSPPNVYFSGSGTTSTIDWTSIASACKNGSIKDICYVGQELGIMVLNTATGSGGSIQKVQVRVRLIDFDHDDLYSQIEGYNDGSYTASATFIADFGKPVRMGSTDTKEAYTASEVYTYLNGTVKLGLPADLSSNLKPVSKKVGSTTSIETIYIPAESELTGKTTISGINEGEQFKAFENCPSYLTYVNIYADTYAGQNQKLWTRSQVQNDTAYYAVLNPDGTISKDLISDFCYIIFCFSI